LKLALVHPNLARKNGVQNVIVWTACGLAARGHEVRVFTERAEPSLWPDHPRLGGIIEVVAPVTRGERIERAMRTGGAIAPRLASFDVVYAHNRDALLWSLSVKDRLVWFCHEPPRRLYAPITDAYLVEALRREDVDTEHPALVEIRDVLRSLGANPQKIRRTGRNRGRMRKWAAEAKRALVSSQFGREAFVAAFARDPVVLDLGVPDTPAGLPASEREGIAVVSSANPKKNLYGLLLAAEELARRGWKDEVFHVWGNGTDTDFFIDQVEKRGLRNRVVLHGFVNDSEARRMLARSKLCVFLSLCEPFGLVVVEALLAGVPMVASSHGGPAEILERCGGGRIVDPLRPTEVADAVEALLAPGEWAARQANAVEAGNRSRELFGMELYLDRIEEMLMSLA